MRQVVGAFPLERVEPDGRGIAADEPAGVGVVVDPAHEQPEQEQHQRVLLGLRANHAAAAAAPVVDQRAEQPEDRSGGAERQ